MKKKELKKLPKEIEEVRVRIEEWRRARTRHGAMPEKLWQDAVALTEKHSVYRVSQGLKVSFSMLKIRVTRAAAKRREFDDRSPPIHEAAGFVELAPSPLFGGFEAPESVVELVGADGARLTVRVPSNQPVDLVELAKAFWRRG